MIIPLAALLAWAILGLGAFTILVIFNLAEPDEHALSFILSVCGLFSLIAITWAIIANLKTLAPKKGPTP